MVKFEEIKKEYNGLYSSMLRKGSLLSKDTGVGFWGPSVTDEVHEAFKKLGLSKYRNFLDLGSGDGKVTLIAAMFCKNATGVEYDPMLSIHANKMKDKLNVLNANFIQDDFHNHDISKYDIVFHAPDAPMHRGVEDKLLRELNGKLILYGHHFHPTKLKKEKSIDVNGMMVTLYSK